MSNRLHLDLGSGPNPRNPLMRDIAIGLDLRGDRSLTDADTQSLDGEVMFWDALRGSLPFETSSVSSVSAYDFLEHIPRVWPAASGDTLYPFVDLMSEIYRVLEPGGLLLAATPGYPGRDAFSDPTHINFISLDTGQYFCGESPPARMYGFKGCFEIELNHFGLHKLLSMPQHSAFYRWTLNFYRRATNRGVPHILWRFRAVKLR